MRHALGRFVVVLTFLAIILVGRPASPTVVIPLTFDEIVDAAGVILVGETVATSARWVDSPGGRLIMTSVTYRVLETLKGQAGPETTLEFLGGQIGEDRLEVSGMPEFTVGDRDVLFVGNRAAISPLIGFAFGRFRIGYDPLTGTDVVRMFDGRSLSAVAAIGRPPDATTGPASAMSLAAFRAAVVDRLRNRR